MITGLLMLAGYFTIHAILAAADMAPLETWLLPAAFGPVFVIGTKMAVEAWLGSRGKRTSNNAQDAGSLKRTILSRVIVPALLAAVLALVIGIAVKSMAVGARRPLPDEWSNLSSMLIFASLTLAELAGAAALALKQYAPGAREYAYALTEYRQARRCADRQLGRAHRARTRSKTEHARLRALQEYGVGRGQLGVVYGRRKANSQAADGDAIVDTVTVDDLQIGAPINGMLPAAQSRGIPEEQFPAPTSTGFGDGDLDAEFRRMVAQREDGPDDHSQETLPWG